MAILSFVSMVNCNMWSWFEWHTYAADRLYMLTEDCCIQSWSMTCLRLWSIPEGRWKEEAVTRTLATTQRVWMPFRWREIQEKRSVMVILSFDGNAPIAHWEFGKTVPIIHESNKWNGYLKNLRKTWTHFLGQLELCFFFKPDVFRGRPQQQHRWQHPQQRRWRRQLLWRLLWRLQLQQWRRWGVKTAKRGDCVMSKPQ